MKEEKCFKAYDIRGNAPWPLNWQFARKLGRAIGQEFCCHTVATGRDARLSGPELQAGLHAGLAEYGVRITDLGLCCTEEIYHATAAGSYDLGIMITGSHNPQNENGFKLVHAGALPISCENGLEALRKRMEKMPENPLAEKASWPYMSQTVGQNLRSPYLDWLLEYAGYREGHKLRRLKIVADAGNGCAGLLAMALAERLPFEFVWLNADVDGSFPNGVPNPLLPEKREHCANAVRSNGADLGIAWDGDADRCFFYDENGDFIEGYYLVGLLASELLSRFPGQKIVHDPRLYWNTREMVLEAGGIPVMGRTGHAFMKERMRQENALYGGEMSAHHYFRDFAYCDSGMIPWLLLAGKLARGKLELSRLLGDRLKRWPCSGEINRAVPEPDLVIQKAEKSFAPRAGLIDKTDGLNMEFKDWRFSLRKSNTEALLRLNVESRADRPLLEERTGELLQFIDSFSKLERE